MKRWSKEYGNADYERAGCEDVGVIYIKRAPNTLIKEVGKEEDKL